MDTQEFKKRLIKMRDAITDYLDNLDMDEADSKPEKGEKKPGPKGAGKPDGKKPEEEED